MSTIAKSAQGTLFKIESSSSAGSFLTIPECTKVVAPNIKYDLLDATSHDSTGGFREFIPGLADGADATADFWWLPTNTVHIQLRVDSYAKTLKNWEIIFPTTGTGSEIDFKAYVVGLSPMADTGQLMKNTLTAKVTGQPTWI